MFERVLVYHHSLIVPEGWQVEYIIINNGSEDQTDQVVERFSSVATFPVRLIQEPRAGHSIALNSGCRAAKGELIAFTDDDAIPDKNWLSEIIRSLSEMKNDWVYGPVIPRWEGRSEPFWFGPTTSIWVACPNYGDEPFLASSPETTFAGVNHACKAHRLFELGLYDEEKGLRGDGKNFAGNDDNLYAKALENGWNVFYNPKVFVVHIIDPKRDKLKPHLINAWSVGRNEFERMRHNSRDQSAGRPRIPRYRYSRFLGDLLGLLRYILIFSPSGFMFHLAKSIRFLGLFYSSLTQSSVVMPISKFSNTDNSVGNQSN